MSIRRVWSEIWTLDNLGHLALWLLVVSVVEWPLWILGGAFDFAWTALPGPIAATLYLFMRERNQIAAEHHDNDFRKGWPWQRQPDGDPSWSLHKWMEAAAPSVCGWLLKLGAVLAI
ncbi:MAG: hypothetical protein ACR2PM_08205 [Hyphomicrobiales bacterium]